ARRVELLEQCALLGADPSWHAHVDEHAMVAAPEALQHRHALAAQHTDFTRLHAGAELELDLAVERLDVHGGAERSLRDREIDLREDVVALAHEPRVGPDAHEHVDVARAA